MLNIYIYILQELYKFLVQDTVVWLVGSETYDIYVYSTSDT